jgi:hypothetical protein
MRVAGGTWQVGVVAAVSASATYLSLFLRMDTTDLLAALYSDCKCAHCGMQYVECVSPVCTLTAPQISARTESSLAGCAD